jgi:hypothetical protein
LIVYAEFCRMKVPGFRQRLDCATPVVRFRLIVKFKSEPASITLKVPAQTSGAAGGGGGRGASGAVGAGDSVVQPLTRVAAAIKTRMVLRALGLDIIKGIGRLVTGEFG